MIQLTLWFLRRQKRKLERQVRGRFDEHLSSRLDAVIIAIEALQVLR